MGCTPALLRRTATMADVRPSAQPVCIGIADLLRVHTNGHTLPCKAFALLDVCLAVNQAEGEGEMTEEEQQAYFSLIVAIMEIRCLQFLLRTLIMMGTMMLLLLTPMFLITRTRSWNNIPPPIIT